MFGIVSKDRDVPSSMQSLSGDQELVGGCEGDPEPHSTLRGNSKQGLSSLAGIASRALLDYFLKSLLVSFLEPLRCAWCLSGRAWAGVGRW